MRKRPHRREMRNELNGTNMRVATRMRRRPDPEARSVGEKRIRYGLPVAGVGSK
jgi:hypothetical protein